jgi:hypothetical protein
MNTPIELLALIFSMFGSILVCSSKKRRRKIAFYIWFIANMIWFNYAIMDNNFYQIMLWLFYIFTAIVGIIKNSENIKKEPYNKHIIEKPISGIDYNDFNNLSDTDLLG